MCQSGMWSAILVLWRRATDCCPSPGTDAYAIYSGVFLAMRKLRRPDEPESGIQWRDELASHPAPSAEPAKWIAGWIEGCDGWDLAREGLMTSHEARRKPLFHDRKEAGRMLASRLRSFAQR